MQNIVLSVMTINNAKAGGIVSRTFNTVSAVQDFSYCGVWFTEIVYVVYDYDVDYDWKTPGVPLKSVAMRR